MRAARIYSPPPLKLWRGPQPSIRSSVVPAPCAARCCSRVAAKIPLNRNGCPLHSTALVVPVRHAYGLRIGPWPSLPQSPLYSPLQPAVVAFRRTYLQGFGASCLRAPGHRRPFAIVTPLAPMGGCSPHSAVTPPPKTSDVRSLVDRPATAPHMHHAAAPQSRTRPRRASTHCTRQGIAPIAPRSPRAQGGHSCRRGPRPCGSRHNARTGSPLSFLRWQASCAPQKPGRRNAPRFIEEALGVDPWPGAPFHQIHLPVECTGRANSPSDGRPRASTSELIRSHALRPTEPPIACAVGRDTTRAAPSTHCADPRGQCLDRSSLL